jgi:hypothetical protein
MKTVFLKAKEHWFIIFVSIFAGLVMVLPQLIFMLNLRSEYKGIYMMQSDAEPHYLAKMQETYDGNKIGNAYYFDEKNIWPVVYYTLSERILALPGMIFGLSVPNINLIYKFFLPIICSLLIYLLAIRLCKDKTWSIITTCLIMFGSPLTSLVDLKHILLFEKVYTQFSLFSRPINPQFSFIFLLLYIFLLFMYVKNNKKYLILLLGILFGLSAYLYIYTFLFLLTLNSVVFIYFIFIKEKRYISTGILLTLLIGICLGLREILEIYMLNSTPLFKQISDLQISGSTGPILGLFQFLTYMSFVLFLVVDKNGRKSHNTNVISCLLITTFIVLNHQLITHMTVQYGHFHWYFNTPIYFIVIVFVVINISRHFSNIFFDSLIKKIFIAISIIAIYSTVFVQYSSYNNNYNEVKNMQSLKSIFDWLNNNNERTCVVLADNTISELIPVYTHCDVLEANYGRSYILSSERRRYGYNDVMKDISLYGKTKYRVDFIVCDKCNFGQYMKDGDFVQVFSNGKEKIFKINDNINRH